MPVFLLQYILTYTKQGYQEKHRYSGEEEYVLPVKQNMVGPLQSRLIHHGG